MEKAHEDFWQKSWKSQAPLARTTKINLQSIPCIAFLGPWRPPPSWILRTRSGGGGCGVYMLVQLSYIPAGLGLTQGKVPQNGLPAES